MVLRRMMCSVLSFLVLVSAIGCASIVSETMYPVSVNSKPSGRDFRILDSKGRVFAAGRTPSVVTLKAGEGYFNGADYMVEIDYMGETISRPIDRGIDLWYAIGNFFIGGLVGYLIVDPATGAMWKLEDTAFVMLDNGQRRPRGRTSSRYYR